MHEIGHALGLSHPGTYNAGSGGSITYANNAEYTLDNRQYTIMSYFGGYAPGSGWQQDGTFNNWLYSSTPMLHDVAAIQAIYGADMTTRTGDTVYGFNANAGRDVFNFSINTSPIITIWDAGGTDTIDLSGYSANQRIDLRQGAYSDVGGLFSNLAIAYNVVIENAVGGSGNDTFLGNDAANALHGGLGNDTIDGAAGNDILAGGAGQDIVVGGGGADRFVFNLPSDGGDTLLDFSTGQDLLVLSRSGFGLAGVGTPNQAGVHFVQGSAATASGASIIFDALNDRLYFDSDGTGPSSQIFLANVPLDGTTASTTEVTVNGNFDGWRSLGSGDFNGDGTDDLLWINSAGQIKISMIANGVVPRELVQQGNVQGWQLVGLGDFNGDGTDDILWQYESTGAVAEWTMSAGEIGTFQRLNGNTMGWTSGGVGDFNNDGTDDVLWQHGSGLAANWLMSNGQIVGSSRFGGNTTGWSVAALGDFNGDSFDDVLWQHESGSNVTWLVNNGTLGSVTRPDGNTSGWTGEGVGDFNADGIDDIVWHHSSGAVIVWEMDAGVRAGATRIPARTSDWTLVSVGDVRGDGGPPDIVWYRAVPGDVLFESVQSWTNSSLRDSDFLIV